MDSLSWQNPLDCLNIGGPMSEKHLLVDFENIQQINPAAVPQDYHITIFTGCSQKTVTVDLARKAQPLGERLRYEQAGASGKNALDFIIAYHVGMIFNTDRKAECIILSKDSGFDSLITHLKKRGLSCRRINSQSELVPKPNGKTDPDYDKVLAFLTKIPKAGRPKTRNTLSAHIRAHLKEPTDSQEVVRIIDHLFVDGKVTESNLRLSYNF